MILVCDCKLSNGRTRQAYYSDVSPQLLRQQDFAVREVVRKYVEADLRVILEEPELEVVGMQTVE